MRDPGAAPCGIERSRRPIGRARYHFAILTHGALAATQRCLRSLAATVPGPFQVFVVDNASADATPVWLRARTEPWLHWQCNAHNRGVPGGRNDLIDFALPHLGAADWLVFCDNDLEFEAGWLESFERAIAAFPSARVLGKIGHLIEVRDDRRVLLPEAATTGLVDVVSGGFACFVRGDALLAIGRFDEQLGLFWHEDDDYCVRALGCGFAVVAVPEAAIVHHEHASGVAGPGLRNGGSLANQAYLAAKWRAAGMVDRGGWVRRPLGSYQPPEVRDELQRRGALPTPIGRAEFAAAWGLLERLVGAEQPQPEFARRREPVPRCLPALLEWNRACALAAGSDDLVRQLDQVAAVLHAESYAARLAPIVKVPEQCGGPVGHGLCAASDFDDPEWLELADELSPCHCARDPHARDLVFWEQVSLALSLRRVGAIRPGARLLFVGPSRPLLRAWFEESGLSVAAFGDARAAEAAPAAAFDIVIGLRDLDPEVMPKLLAHGSALAVFAFSTDVVLDGAPLRLAPAPLQIEHDLLARVGLQPVLPVRTIVDPSVLEACVDRHAAATRRPQLSTLRGGRLITSCIVVARAAPAPVAAPMPLVAAPPQRSAWAAIAVDLRTVAFADSTARGIGHYTVHHLAAVARREPGVRLWCLLPAGTPLPSALALPNVVAADVDDYRADAFDLVHLPDPMNLAMGYDSPLRAFRHDRTTVTFHDLTPLRHYVAAWPERTRAAYDDRLRQLQRSQAHLLCNSQFTAADAVATLGLDPARATAILAGWNGHRAQTDAATLAAVRRRLGIRGPFVLHVGALDPHKNFAASLSAFLQVRARRPLQLVVVGAVDPGIEYFGGFCAARTVPDVLFTGYLPRRDLDALYTAASGLLFLSRSEGFGFPLLEAMAAGCPVVGTAVTSHPEVVGDAGQLVPVDDPAAAAVALERLLAEPQFAAQCRERGRARAAQFSWDAVADRTLAVWRRLVAAASTPRKDQLCTPGASMPVFSTHST